jgi:hypothetical protein
VKNSYYFPHDYHARFDPKLCALIKTFGMEGYGTWWMLVEIMHEQGGQIEKFPKLYEGLAQDLKQNEAHLKQIISALISDFKLLKEDAEYIWSDRVLRNMKDLEHKRTQKVEAGRLGGIESGKKRSKTKQNEAPLEANEQKESKVKESNIKESNIPMQVFPFDEIYLKYPNKVGKKAAQRHFEASVKTEQDWLDIQTALKNYLVSDKVAKGFIQNASTWFNDWISWVKVDTQPKTKLIFKEEK